MCFCSEFSVLSYRLNANPEPRTANGSLISSDPRQVAGIFLERGHNGFFAAEPLAFHLFQRLDYAFIIFWQYLHKLGHHLVPKFENIFRALAMGVFGVVLDHRPYLVDLLLSIELFERDHLAVASARKIAGPIQPAC